MKHTTHLSVALSFIITLVSMFYNHSATAQSEDKSYLKQLDPNYKSHDNDFIPMSKYGLVVTFSNLSEALKNPSIYKCARFNDAGLTDFPEQIFLFANLEELDVSRNAITTVPLRLNELKNLKELHLNKNRLTSLGTEITSCSNLVVLQIQDNPLEKITGEISKMLSLKELTIGEIAINCTIPSEVWELTNLTKLKLLSSNLTEIPTSIDKFKQLNEFCVADNSISEIPEALYTLTNITYVNFGGNKITSISPSIKALENLNYLGLYNNPITKLPDEIGNLKKLSFLSCWKTKLSEMEVEKARKEVPLANVHNTETGLH